MQGCWCRAFSTVGDPKFDNDPTAKVRPTGIAGYAQKLGLLQIYVPSRLLNAWFISRLACRTGRRADFLCIRELTGGMYFGEKYQDNDKAYDTNMYTRPGSR